MRRATLYPDDPRAHADWAHAVLFDFQDLICWPAGTGYALGDWLRTIGIEPKFMTWEERAAQSQEANQDT